MSVPNGAVRLLAGNLTPRQSAKVAQTASECTTRCTHIRIRTHIFWLCMFCLPNRFHIWSNHDVFCWLKYPSMLCHFPVPQPQLENPHCVLRVNVLDFVQLRSFSMRACFTFLEQGSAWECIWCINDAYIFSLGQNVYDAYMYECGNQWILSTLFLR